MIQKGANGYISKTCEPDEIQEAIKNVYTNGIYLGDWVKKEYFRKEYAKGRNVALYGKENLTQKEVEFIRYASTNLNYKEIALKMMVSPKTIENYRNSLFFKLNISNRAAMTLVAIKLGLIDPFVHNLQ
jgi:DNA-binding NarL/FixJ family response regulator